jgi:hypothetical protein
MKTPPEVRRVRSKLDGEVDCLRGLSDRVGPEQGRAQRCPGFWETGDLLEVCSPWLGLLLHKTLDLLEDSVYLPYSLPQDQVT